jgi:pimeloyl-ACP methyl ester carboxylesterase
VWSAAGEGSMGVRAWRGAALVVAALTGSGLLAAPARAATQPQPARLPVVFVHGNAGSAAQFETQFERFTSNGYPQRLLFAYEYDTSVPGNDAAVAGLGPYLDGVLARTGARQVYLIGHSRGTTVSHAFLADPAQAAKVARYVNLDGRSSAAPPGGVPTLALWGEWQSPPEPVFGVVGAIVGARNVYNADQSHVEVSSSARTFDAIHRFLFGRPPATTAVRTSPGLTVRVAGRAVLFPQNAGFAGATLQVWPVNPLTGHRLGARPVSTTALDASGDFGPLTLAGGLLPATYEFAVIRPGGTVHHFYQQAFRRDDLFVRLNSAPAGTGLELFTPTGPDHVNAVLVRAREMWGDQGAGSDRLTVDTLGDRQPALEILTPATAPRHSNRAAPTGQVGENNAIFITDVGAPAGATYGPPDRLTDLGKGQLSPFDTITFLGAVDEFVPADARARGVVRFALAPRGGGRPDVVNVPNWPSDQHRITIDFNDDNQ